MIDLPSLAIMTPLVYAIIAFAAGQRTARILAPVALTAFALLAAALVDAVVRDGVQRVAVAGWAAPLGIELVADGLACAMVAMTAAVSLGAGLYALWYLDPREPGTASFWPLGGLLIASLNALFLSADLFNVYVALELLGLAAVGLVALQRSAPAIAAALRYLLAALLGSLAYLMGVALTYGAHGTLAFAELSLRMSASPVAWSALALICVGMLLKTALFPLHFWLPPAHGGAVTPASALLSAVVIKGSFYVLLRLWFDVFGAAVGAHAAHLLGALGAAAVLWGSLLAMRQLRLKMVVAYSTVAQVGYLFLLFPLATDARVAADAWSGGVYHAVSHAFAKSAMFLAAGAMIAASPSDRIDRLAGVAQRVPIGVFAFALAGMSIMGLPPTGGFIAKWLLLASAVASGQWWWAVVLLAGGALAAVYVFRVLRWAFVMRGVRSEEPIAALRPLELIAMALALIAIGLGFAPQLLLRLLQVGPMASGAL
ncbi:MAG TPA: proton-conducting transporter membrane subunit [Burkholderiaceae bacterium]|nr:proton-conducting transporter membrane subunit [Burkholderiaceae bacterium]